MTQHQGKQFSAEQTAMRHFSVSALLPVAYSPIIKRRSLNGALIND